jgi:hypothetical protein
MKGVAFFTLALSATMLPRAVAPSPKLSCRTDSDFGGVKDPVFFRFLGLRPSPFVLPDGLSFTPCLNS